MENAARLIKQHVKAGQKIAVACSGGRDSMALLHLCKSLQNEIGFELLCVNIDHNLREIFSQKDSAFVQSFCCANNIPFAGFFVDVKNRMRFKALSGEQEARNARVDTFVELKTTASVRWLLVAHHAKDQAETVLLHLLFGSGLLGASGMKTIRENYFFRPMLLTSSAAVEQYILQHKIPFVIDHTNHEDMYLRNYLRNQVFPLLNARWDAEANLSRFATRAQIDEDYIASCVPHPKSTDNGILMDKQVLKSHKAIAVRYIFAAFKLMGIYADILQVHIDSIIDLAKKQSAKTCSLPHGLQAIVEEQGVLLTVKTLAPPSDFCTQFLGAGQYELPHGTLFVREVQQDKLDDIRPFVKDIKIIDAHKLPCDCVLRYRRAGDYMIKFGGVKTQLKKLLNQKVPLLWRNQTILLCCEEQVLYVGGTEISDTLKIDEHTKLAYILEFDYTKEDNEEDQCKKN